MKFKNIDKKFIILICIFALLLIICVQLIIKVNMLSHYENDLVSRHGEWVSQDYVLEDVLIECYDFVKKREYIKDYYDCDNFALDFKLLSQLKGWDVEMIVIYSKGKEDAHVMNKLNMQGKTLLLEPNGCFTFKDYNEAWDFYYGPS